MLPFLRRHLAWADGGSSAGAAHHTSGYFAAAEHTLAEYYAVLNLIHWIQQHQEYMSAAGTIAEYATKTALFRYLPPTSATHYAHLLSNIGIHVDSVGMGEVGRCAMEMAVPALSDLYTLGHSSQPHQSGDASFSSSFIPPVFLAGNAAVSIIHHIIEQIRDIAGMALQNDAGHAKMAKYISEVVNKHRHGADGCDATDADLAARQAAFSKAAVEAYGTGAHWLALALPDIEHRGGAMLFHQADALAAELSTAYSYWTMWARHSSPQLQRLEAQAAHFANELHSVYPKHRTPEAEGGLFVAGRHRLHAQPSGAPLLPAKEEAVPATAAAEVHQTGARPAAQSAAVV